MDGQSSSRIDEQPSSQSTSKSYHRNLSRLEVSTQLRSRILIVDIWPVVKSGLLRCIVGIVPRIIVHFHSLILVILVPLITLLGVLVDLHPIVMAHLESLIRS